MHDRPANLVALLQASRVHDEAVGEDNVAGAADELNRLDSRLDLVHRRASSNAWDPVVCLGRCRVEQLRVGPLSKNPR